MQTDGGAFTIEEGRLVAYRGYESTVAVPPGVSEIGERAFWGARLMTRVTLPSSLRTIGAWAFAGCTGLREVDFGTGDVTEIGAHAFFACSALTEAWLPASLVRLGSAAFDGCLSLALVTVPARLVGIGAFHGCRALRSVRVSPKNRVFSEGEGVLFAAGGTLLRYPPGREAFAYTVPAGVVRLAPGALSDATMLREVTLPGSLADIGQGAFYRAKHLRTLTLPDGVTALGAEAFGACASLAHVTLSQSLREIPPLAFYGCGSLGEVGLPPAVTRIGEGAFLGCRSLGRLTAGRLSFVGENAFSGCEALREAVLDAPPAGVSPGNDPLLTAAEKI